MASDDLLTALAKYRINPQEGKVYGPLGCEVGSLGTDGYYRITIYGSHPKRWTVRRCMAVFWKFNGYWPASELDHRDRDKTNDKIGNLAESSHSNNMLNRRTSDNRELPPGVHLRRRMRSKPYAATYKRRHLGLFATPEEAHQAYLQAKGE
jgi:hypothetical protein